MASQVAGNGLPTEAHSEGVVRPMSTKRKRLRKRRIYSCFECRERKTKCNRELPCEACEARGDASICMYDVGEAEQRNPAHGAVPRAAPGTAGLQKQRETFELPSNLEAALQTVMHRLDRLERSAPASTAIDKDSAAAASNGHYSRAHDSVEWASTSTHSRERGGKHARDLESDGEDKSTGLHAGTSLSEWKGKAWLGAAAMTRRTAVVGATSTEAQGRTDLALLTEVCRRLPSLKAAMALITF